MLGRAAALVLADEPARCTSAWTARRTPGSPRWCAGTGRSSDEVRRDLRSNDAARTGYVRHFYRCDPGDARHYHLVLDTTAIPWDAAADLVVAAARARGV